MHYSNPSVTGGQIHTHTEEYCYDPLPDVIQGSFAAAHAFFVANGHEVTTIDCPNFDAFLVASPGAIVCRIAELPVLVLLQGGQLLLNQALARLTSGVGGFVIGWSAPTFAAQLFLDCYLELPAGSISSLSFATVLPSHGALVIQVEGGDHHVPPLVHHMSLSSCPDLVSVDIGLSACPLLRYGSHGLIPYNLVPPYVHSPPALHADYNYRGFFHAAPPPAKDFHYYRPHNGHPLHHGGHLFTQTSSSVYGGHPATLRDAPSFVYRGGTTFPQGHGGYPCVAASVTPSLGFAGLLIHPSLLQSNHHSSSGLDITTSYSSPGQGLPPAVLQHPRASGVIPPSALSSLAVAPASTTKVLKLNPIKDAKAYLDALGIIEFYLQDPNFSSGLLDGALVTTHSNCEASCLWDGHLHLAVKDGKLCFLFENKGDIYNSRGFEMLSALNTCCCPDSVANAFSSLLSIFNELQVNNKPILAFRSWFDGLIFEMARCKVVIPSLLLVMLFLHALHSCYSNIVEQFRTPHKLIETTSVDMIIDNVTYHDDFILKNPRCANKSPKPPSQVPTAAAAHTDNAGTVWSSPIDWLSMSYGDKGIRNRWKKALGGNGSCPMCHRGEPKHVPKDCPLLKLFNLKLIQVAPTESPPAPAPAASTPAAASPSPGGHVATADLPPSGGTTGSANAHLVLGLALWMFRRTSTWMTISAGMGMSLALIMLIVNITSQLPFTPCAVQSQCLFSNM
jgi:hypothetical protein